MSASPLFGTSPNPSSTGVEIRDRAREQGVLAALELLNRSTATEFPRGPGGHAVVPEPQVQVTAAVEVALDGGSLVALRAADVPESADEPSSEWQLGLVWLRLGISERLLENCLDYLGGRTAGGTPLLVQQMVRGQLAEARGDQIEVELMLAQGALPSLLADLHERITRTDRSLCRLLGASSVVETGPGQEAYASELLADVYSPRTAPEPKESAA